MGAESQGVMPEGPEGNDGEKAPVLDIFTGKEAEPTQKPVEQQIRDEVHGRIASGDYAVPEFVTDSKDKKPAFESDPNVEFQATEKKKMDADVQSGWEGVKPREFKL
jgi:hypothetical protein